jgi:hypothetical protein
MTFLKELRDAAMKCSNPDYRETLKRAADRIEERIAQLTDTPTHEAMIGLNGAWARAYVVLKNTPPEAEPTPPVSSAAEAEEPLRMAA